MKACTSISIRDNKIHYLRSHLSGSQIVIERQGEVELNVEDAVEPQLMNIVHPQDMVCVSLDSHDAITRHVASPKVRGQQARKMARFQLETHLQGLDSGPYDCDTIALDKDKHQSHWLLTAQKRSLLEEELKAFSNIPNMSNGLKLKGYDELFRRVISPASKKCIVFHFENSYISMYYYDQGVLCFLRRNCLPTTNIESFLFNELKRSCLLRDIDLPEVIYRSGPDMNKVSLEKLEEESKISSKDLLLNNVQSESSFNTSSGKLDLLGLSWLRLSDSKIHNIYHEEGEHANESIDLQRRFCTPLILFLVLIGFLYLKDSVALSHEESKAKSLKSQAYKIFKTAMPADNRRKFNEQSYLRYLSTRVSKQKGSKNKIKLEQFMKNIQQVLENNVDFLMTNLNYQPAKGRTVIHGYVKNLKEFEKLNVSLRRLKEYSITANFRKPGKGSSLGLRVSLSLEARK
jgi:hypothetical protein